MFVKQSVMNWILPFSLMCQKSILFFLSSVKHWKAACWCWDHWHFTQGWHGITLETSDLEGLRLTTDCQINLPAGRSVLLIRHHHQLRSVPDLCKIFGINKGSGIAFNESSNENKLKSTYHFSRFTICSRCSWCTLGTLWQTKEAISWSCQVLVALSATLEPR